MFYAYARDQDVRINLNKIESGSSHYSKLKKKKIKYAKNIMGYYFFDFLR